AATDMMGEPGPSAGDLPLSTAPGSPDVTTGSGTATATSSDAGAPGGSNGQPLPTCPASATAVAGERTQSLMVGGQTRTYLLHVPPGYTGRAPVPVVFDF